MAALLAPVLDEESVRSMASIRGSWEGRAAGEDMTRSGGSCKGGKEGDGME